MITPNDDSLMYTYYYNMTFTAILYYMTYPSSMSFILIQNYMIIFIISSINERIDETYSSEELQGHVTK